MNEIRCPEDIFHNVLDKKISKNEAFKLLESLVNESNNSDIRAGVIDTLEKLSIFNEAVYFLLEKALLSDESDVVRFKAARALIKNYSFSEDTPLFYVLENEQSIYFLRNLLQLCLSLDKEICKRLQRLIETRISKFYNLNPDDAKFIMDIDYLDYIKFKDNFHAFVDKFNIQEYDSQELLQEKVKLGYKGLGRIIKRKDGFILGLRLHDFNEIPISIQNLKKLEYLEIKRSDLGNLVDYFENLRNLKYLVLSNNTMAFVPEWIFEVVKKRDYALKYIKNGVNFSEAQILGLLEILLGQALVKLEQYESFNPSLLYYFKINHNGNITGINISSDLNKIGIIPEKLCTLKYLKELIMPNQNIKKIPQCISKLQQLESLDLRNNELYELPKVLNDLKHLKSLKLEGNEISTNNLIDN